MTSTRREISIWLQAIRPHTLWAGIAPVILGTAVAVHDDVFRWLPALAALAVAVLIQIGTNFANDVFDHHRGVDVEGRLGPQRVTASGIRTSAQMYRATALVFAAAAIIGIYLIFQGGWPVALIGLLSIVSALAYSGGPLPIGYHGLGDLFVFLFFGLAATCGTYLVQAGSVSELAWWAAVPAGFLSTAILIVNNLRDIVSDLETGKRTLAVIIGKRWTRIEFSLLTGASFLIPVFMWASGTAGPWVLLSWLAIPIAVEQVSKVRKSEGAALNPALGGTARLELVYCLLLSAGLILQRFL